MGRAALAAESEGTGLRRPEGRAGGRLAQAVGRPQCRQESHRPGSLAPQAAGQEPAPSGRRSAAACLPRGPSPRCVQGVSWPLLWAPPVPSAHRHPQPWWPACSCRWTSCGPFMRCFREGVMVAKKDRRPTACTLTCPASPTCRSCRPPASLLTRGPGMRDRLAPLLLVPDQRGHCPPAPVPAPAPSRRSCLPLQRVAARLAMVMPGWHTPCAGIHRVPWAAHPAGALPAEDTAREER